jgi:hypothetical protein
VFVIVVVVVPGEVMKNGGDQIRKNKALGIYGEDEIT